MNARSLTSDEAGQGYSVHALARYNSKIMDPASGARETHKTREQPLVLVADDDPDIRSLVGYVLEGDGYDVRLAGDGFEALNLYLEVGPDLVILDVMMPRRTGLEVLRELEMRGERRPDIPVLMLTARRSEDDVMAGFELGIQDYLTKPFLIGELRARVRRLLAQGN